MASSSRFPVISLKDVPFEDARHSSDRHRPVVLVVDDESMVADTLALILSRAGFATLTAYSATTALEVAEAVPPELLISDVAMPGMNGIDLAVSIVNAWPDCKVLLFSGHAIASDLLAARAAGYSFPLIAKPVHPAEMVRQAVASLSFEDAAVAIQ
jgi:CheY-like chemotaxis protein